MSDVQQKSWQRQAAGGAAWMGFGTMLGKSVVFLSGIVLARLLLPTDFGRNAMALVISNLLITIGSLGTGAALIQRQDRPETYACCAFWLGLALGTSLAFLQLILAPLAGRFFHEPIVSSILLLTAPMHLLVAVGNTPLALLNKQMKFKHTAFCNLMGPLVGSGFSICLALLGWGVWSLAWSPVITLGISSLLGFVLCRWRPRWEVEREPMMNLLHYTGTMLPGEICLFLNYNMDNMIVGWRLGSEQLGHYSLAYTLGMFLAIVSGAIMLSVIFPLFSRLQNQRDQLLVCYQQVLGAVGVLGTPITIWLIMEAPIFIPWVFGEKWTPAIVPLQTICSLGLLRTIAMQPASALAKAIGRPDLSSRSAMVLTPLALAGFLFGSRFGIVGVSMAALLVLGSGSLFFAYIVIRVAGWKLTEIVRSLAWPAIVGLGAFSILALRRTICSLNSRNLQIAADLSLLIFVYGFIAFKLGPRLATVTHRKV